ncbi:polysaccharide biosynthesis/export family protein [Dysgonomonas sp. 25]|uniref:polysaccharide biosynthesis/export family protein n=1 Tax=Dysgonomonas sp. 25 TaxID=2302933 RepID=UPI0013D72B62|nr:polysaccharide biosynthesis/export family protein [Dysgonomonas sp. 25]NDV68748.1 hypothetical protein [Dysgonomonas sp. 25]
MKSKKILLLLLPAIWLLSSCVTTRDTNFFQDIHKEYEKIKEPEYKVIVGDELLITVYTMEPKALQETLGSFSQGGTLNVRADGTIKIPFMGKVYVEGYTLYEIGKILSEKFSALADGTTATVQLTSMYITFLGETGQGRVIMDKPIMTIYEVLSTSTGQNFRGDRKRVTILRQTSAGSVIKEFDLRSKDIVDSEFYYVQPNDVIYMPKLAREMYTGGTASTLGGIIGILTGLIGLGVMLLKLF